MTRPGDEVFHTHPADCVVAPSGWFRLPSGLEVTAEPPLDATTIQGDAPGLYARCSQMEAEQAAKALGGRLLTRNEVLEVCRVGHRLDPVTLPADNLMASRRRCEEHDAQVRSLLASTQWDGSKVVAGLGKWRISGGDPRNERICGWPRRNGQLIQAGVQDIHLGEGRIGGRTDYATLFLVARSGLISFPPVAA